MDERAPVDLIHLSDGEDVSLVLRAVGPPGVLLGPIRAECLIRADFVQARLDTHIWPDLLDEWEEALARLGAGEDAGWAQGGRGLRLYFHPSDSGRLSLSVHDPDRLTVALGLEPPPQWIEEHEIRLRRMREVYGES
ncbi:MULTISPECIES: DUF5959 family protein [Streptomyces]|uniref:DUF5959 family protein n=1 Tax=Streptomyces TaxID=1883 RepID=UPI000E1DB3C9|nr:DUF5959 family protein [Streptomyces sp. M7]RDS61807.1 hypothetical protein DWC19_29530 [Streptomyces sp. M7]